MTALGALVERCYERYASSPALYDGAGWKSFSELRELTARVAHALAELGTGPGERVIIALTNRPEYLAIDHALFISGRIRVALSPRLHVAEIASIVHDCGASVVIAEAALAEGLAADVAAGAERVTVVATEPVKGVAATLEDLISFSAGDLETEPSTPDDAVAIMYTSGSTGEPKGAVVTDRAWVAMVRALWAELPPIGPGDVILHAAPMSHFGGSVGSAYTLHGAATATVERYRASELLGEIERHRATVVPLVPTMLKELVAATHARVHDATSLRALPYGGSAVSPRTLEKAYRAFGDVLYQFYGLSEALIPLTALSAREHGVETHAGGLSSLASAGRPTPSVSLRIVNDSGRRVKSHEVGEVQVRGDVVTAGYWNRPTQSAEAFVDGWLKTGDLGTLDKDGYLHILDRIRDVIVTGGFTVYAAELEQVIESLEGVAEAAVVASPSEHWGETITAVIVPRAGHQVSADDVVSVCSSRLASYKRPTRVEFVGRLPKTSTGKLNRREVREWFWTAETRRVGE